MKMPGEAFLKEHEVQTYALWMSSPLRTSHHYCFTRLCKVLRRLKGLICLHRCDVRVF